jgi:hypothetical protein
VWHDGNEHTTKHNHHLHVVSFFSPTTEFFFVETKNNNQKMASTHPLQNEWSVWEHHECDPKQSASGYSQSMKEIYRFKTVEDFWAFFNNYPKMRFVVVVVVVAHTTPHKHS